MRDLIVRPSPRIGPAATLTFQGTRIARLRSMGCSDTELEAEVRKQLLLDPFVPHRAISTVVEHGVITLRGTVECTSQRLAAESAIRDLPGARSVVNEIEVGERQIASLGSRR
ncbi:MAG: BON domain-containing protein [Kofleriaceae bacterium]